MVRMFGGVLFLFNKFIECDKEGKKVDHFSFSANIIRSINCASIYNIELIYLEDGRALLWQVKRLHFQKNFNR